MPRSQLSLQLKPRYRHGGARPGAGRPRNLKRVSHARRPRALSRHGLHVTFKLRKGLPGFRRPDCFRLLRDSVRLARKKGLAVIHFAILGDHLHLVLEPPRDGTLGRAIQSLCISFSRRLNRRLGRLGAVFADRYHMRVLKTPTEARRAIAYVLTNDSHHRGEGKSWVRVDPFSSAAAFRDWKALLGRMPRFELSGWPRQSIENWLAQALTPASGWLLREGWRKGHRG